VSPAVGLFIWHSLLLIAVLAVSLIDIIKTTKGNRLIMSLADDLNTAVASLKDKDDQIIALVTSQTTTIANLNATVAALQAQVNAGSVDPAAVQGAIDALNAEATRVSAALPSVPAPTGGAQ